MDYARSVQVLSRQGDICAARIQNLEERLATLKEETENFASSRMSTRSVDTIASIRLIRESIILNSFHGSPYADNLFSASETSFVTAHEAQDTYPIASDLVEAYLDRKFLQ